MSKHAYFESIQPGELFAIENDDGSMEFCFKVIIGDGEHGCLILANNDFKIEFCSPEMLVVI